MSKLKLIGAITAKDLKGTLKGLKDGGFDRVGTMTEGLITIKEGEHEVFVALKMNGAWIARGAPDLFEPSAFMENRI